VDEDGDGKKRGHTTLQSNQKRRECSVDRSLTDI